MTSPTAFRILIADDDPDLLFTLRSQLRTDGFAVEAASSGEAAMAAAERTLPHLAIVDLLMPGINGFEVARRLKRLGDVPIIMLSAIDDEDTVIKGLEQYADDYVTKPFSYRMLLARVRRVLERAWAGGEPPPPTIAVGEGIEVDFTRRRLTRPGEPPERLTPTEARILLLLSNNSGQVLPNALILDRVWPDGGGSIQTLWEYVRRLRLKLHDDPDAPRFIQSERGVGYRLNRPA
jgi:DNA-binding response OmpR family regulator